LLLVFSNQSLPSLFPPVFFPAQGPLRQRHIASVPFNKPPPRPREQVSLFLSASLAQTFFRQPRPWRARGDEDKTYLFSTPPGRGATCPLFRLPLPPSLIEFFDPSPFPPSAALVFDRYTTNVQFVPPTLLFFSWAGFLGAGPFFPETHSRRTGSFCSLFQTFCDFFLMNVVFLSLRPF